MQIKMIGLLFIFLYFGFKKLKNCQDYTVYKYYYASVVYYTIYSNI